MYIHIRVGGEYSFRAGRLLLESLMFVRLRIMPIMTLSSPCAFFEGCRSFLMVITADCRLHVW